MADAEKNARGAEFLFLTDARAVEIIGTLYTSHCWEASEVHSAGVGGIFRTNGSIVHQAQAWNKKRVRQTGTATLDR